MMQVGGNICHCDENRRLEQLNIENGRTKPRQGTRKCSAPSSESPAGRQEVPWKRSNVAQSALEKKGGERTKFKVCIPVYMIGNAIAKIFSNGHE
jgi:hypothetical protein